MNLSDTIKGYLPQSIVDDIASKTGETSTGISSFINAAIPTIASILIASSSADSRGIFKMAKNAFATGGLGNLPGTIGSKEESSTVSDILNSMKNNLSRKGSDSLIQTIASYAGVKESTGKLALEITSFATLGALGRHIKENNLNAGGLKSFLDEQKKELVSWFPEGFNKSSIAGLGLAGLAPLQKEISLHDVTTPGAFMEGKNLSQEAVEQNKQPYKKGWLIPLFILLAVIAIFWSFLKKI